MIAAIDAREFIPRGRQAVEEHPGPPNKKETPKIPSDQILLHRLQSVNISSDDDNNELWSVREIFSSDKKASIGEAETESRPASPNYLIDADLNTEEELYFKGYVAAWMRGIQIEDEPLERILFSCETPIKFAFFCHDDFVVPTDSKYDKKEEEIEVCFEGKIEEQKTTYIGLIDATSLRIYCSTGETFLANMEFQVSNVWQAKYGIILEKEPSNTLINFQSISMPRFFLLAHPLDEICPLLIKSHVGSITYITEADYRIIYSSHETDLVLMFDSKVGKHFVAKLRKATEDEIHAVSGLNDNNMTGLGMSNRGGGAHTISQSSMKHSGFMKNTSSVLGKSTPVNVTHHSSHAMKFGANTTATAGGAANRTNAPSPLSRLQSSLGIQSLSVHDMRKIGQTEPAKPIVPEYCLEHVWTENTSGRDIPEEATKAFIHIDIVGHSYLCYLLPRSGKLVLTLMEKTYSTLSQMFGKVSIILAKDAVCLPRMRMIVVLAYCGTITLYTGPVMISKVHVVGIVPPNLPSTSMTSSYSSAFPRRSSLLPTVASTVESTFEDEIHLLSPVHPLQPQSKIQASSCLSLRDPACNRFTLVYPGGKMYRVTLPLISESPLISRSITVLRQILSKELLVQFIVKWYGVRNSLGAKDFNTEDEWERFKIALTEIMGRSQSINESTQNTSSEEPNKKRKEDEDEDGTDEDWEYLLNRCKPAYMRDNSNVIIHNDPSAPLFPYIPVIFYSFHLMYEEFKLELTMYHYLPYLVEFLHQFAVDMELQTYCLHYFLDFPGLVHKSAKHRFTERDAQKMLDKDILREPAPNIYKHIVNIIQNKELYQYPHILKVNTLSRNIIQIVSLICHGAKKLKTWFRYVEFVTSSSSSNRPKRMISAKLSRSEQLVQVLMQMNIDRNDVENFPPAIHFLITQCLENCRINPPIGWEADAYELMERTELVLLAGGEKKTWPWDPAAIINFQIEDSLSPRVVPPIEFFEKTEEAIATEDGMEDIDTQLLRLRFPQDLRILEVRRMLISSEPVLIDITQSLGVSDHDFIEEQEKQLYALCTRTMSLPMGRGMLTLRTTTPKSTEPLPIPKLCLTGKEPIKGATVEMQQIEIPPNMNLWPTFHNGVAAGLRVQPNAVDIDSTWIVYNKPKGQADISTEHAGFLMGLGLNGHLKNLSFMSIYEYLVKCDEMTGVGLLLGISATHRGTMDTTTTKLLSVHIEALLPATSLELDIPQNIQVASLMGVGLVYQGSAKRHIAEVLLQEIGRPPGPEMENSVERESYALTAGLALGLVTLGQEELPAGLRDLQLPDTLHYYMVGGNKRQLAGSQKEKYKLASFQVREGETVNIDVTAPGATLALGLMYFNSGNQAVAAWMKPPDTSYLLDLIRPDLLLLRIIARGLIMWSNIEPTRDWLFQQFPANLEFDIHRGPDDINGDIDHEAITQAYCNIIAGAAFCIGLRYAGTEDPVAFKTLRKTIQIFLNMNGQYVVEYAGKVTVENSLMVILLAISLVCAGTGNLEVLRLIRYLRSRIGVANSHVTYGSQMAIHMALGFLFLGAGRFTLSRRPEAIAALVCALFPKFPNHSNDNRYHLQALRHLYVLAVEPRLFLPRDIDSGKLCLCHISVIEMNTDQARELPLAPCMLPELNSLKAVKIIDSNYWPISFERGRNWDQLLNVLENCDPIDVQKRAGCLSHVEDPDRLKSLLAQTLTSEQYSCWQVDKKTLLSFSSDPRVYVFTETILCADGEKEDLAKGEPEKIHLMKFMFYNCLRRDKMHAFEICVGLFGSSIQIQKNVEVWQIKIIKAFRSVTKTDTLFIDEILDAIVAKAAKQIEEWCLKYATELKNIITSSSMEPLKSITKENLDEITSVMAYYDLIPNVFNSVDLSGQVNYLRLLYEFKKLNMDPEAVSCIKKLINIS